MRKGQGEQREGQWQPEATVKVKNSLFSILCASLGAVDAVNCSKAQTEWLEAEFTMENDERLVRSEKQAMQT